MKLYNRVSQVFTALFLLAVLFLGTAGPRHRLATLFPSPVTKTVISPLPKPEQMHDFPFDIYSYAFGQCTWWAQIWNPDEPLIGLGDAKDWADHARYIGLPVGTVPRVGATVVFPAYFDDNSDGDGHVAHVEAVYSNGWFLVSEMNALAGGWGVVSWRVIWPDPALRFIY